jgi:hypothetical protein
LRQVGEQLDHLHTDDRATPEGSWVFTAEERDRVREQLLTRAEADSAITGAAFTGSHATGGGDRWSDTDLVLAVRGELSPVLNQWTQWLRDQLGALHHWDLPAGARIIRVFLLPGWIEIDLTFAPEDEFGPRGPQWRTVFGHPQPLAPFPAPDPQHLAGLIWHHALHAFICTERGRWWQAEHWISALRDHAITLACLRLGHPAAYAKGAHLLPGDLTAPLETTLVRSRTRHRGGLVRVLMAVVAIHDDGLQRARGFISLMGSSFHRLKARRPNLPRKLAEGSVWEIRGIRGGFRERQLVRRLDPHRSWPRCCFPSGVDHRERGRNPRSRPDRLGKSGGAPS